MESIIPESIVATGKKFRPLVYWYLSMRCNLACKHCWVESSPDADTSADLSVDEIRNTIASLKSEVDPSFITYTGGEPLFRRDITQILESTIEHRIPFSVETNAMLIRDHHVAVFRKAHEAGVYCWISVSLDGGNQEAHEWVRGRGSFASALRGMRRLKDANIPFGVQCVVNRKNLSSVPGMFEVGTDLGLVGEDNVLAFVIVNPVGRGAEAVDDLSISYDEYVQAFQMISEGLSRYKGNVLVKVPPAAIPVHYLQRFMNHPQVRMQTSCSFPLLGILPDGTLSVCALTGQDGSLVLGHVRKDSLKTVVTTQIEPLRENYDQAKLEGVCADCVFKQNCKGSCRAFAYAETGSFIGPSPICDALERQGLFPQQYRLSYREKLRSRVPAGVGD